MFLKAGVLSLALLLASRLLGLLRESTQAAAFGATGTGDIAVLMLSLPDWLAGVLASGALAYVLLPAWAHEDAGRIASGQRRIARLLLGGGLALALLLVLLHAPAVRWLLPGLPQQLQPQASQALVFSALALPMALLAALGVTRLQHERDFVGMYAASMVVNLVLVAALVVMTVLAHTAATAVLGTGLVAAMAARLEWLRRRQRPYRREIGLADSGSLPALPLWFWAAAAAGLPMLLPFVARSLASRQGEGALATFNYAWKLVELPLVLAVQLVGILALGPIAKALRSGAVLDAAPMRRGFALAWTLACACVAALLLAAPAVAQLLFGWGRMQPEAIAHVAQWGRIGAWSLLPQALVTIAAAVLAAQERMRVAVLAYALAFAVLLVVQPSDGVALMAWLVGLLTAVAVVVLAALREHLPQWLPWTALATAGALLLALQALLLVVGTPTGLALQWGSAVASACAILGLTWTASADLRQALAR